MEDLGRQVMDARDQAAQAIDMMLADLRQKWQELSGGPTMTEGLRRFIAAVDWSVRRPACWEWSFCSACICLEILAWHMPNHACTAARLLHVMPLQLSVTHPCGGMGAATAPSISPSTQFTPRSTS